MRPGKTTPAVIRAKKRKKRNKALYMEAIKTEAAKRDISVWALLQEKFHETQDLRDHPVVHSVSYTTYGHFRGGYY